MAQVGERKSQILQTLAGMLEQPQGEKITTALLAARVGVSEAALYRHFASKAQMFEGLIEFIEQSIFGLINRITSEESGGLKQTQAILELLLRFAEKNPGMTRVMIGDALVHEHERLQARINRVHDRLEASLRQSLRIAATQNEITDQDFAAYANMLMSFVIGRWHLFAKSGFSRSPLDHWKSQQAYLVAPLALKPSTHED